MLDAYFGIFVFTFVILLLVTIILVARSLLVPVGNIKILINGDDEKSFEVLRGGKLLSVLADKKYFLSSACGGGGTCAQCKVRVVDGASEILATEEAHINYEEKSKGVRLACQLTVKENLSIELEESVFGVKKWKCKVRSNQNVATFIKELTLELPKGEVVPFRAGGYIQIESPAYQINFQNDIDVTAEYREDWDKMNLWRFTSEVTSPVVRAYSMANYPEEKGIIMLNVRIAFPPFRNDKVPPGKMSSYIFSLKEGDEVTISGPYGEFFATENSTEMIFIGGGAGMAPMRAHLFDQFKRINTNRKVSFWYGARSKKEIFYDDDFDELVRNNKNFNWHVALSEPSKEDSWTGDVGFIHQVLYDKYLKEHATPEDCEYYICGPPMMNTAVLSLLDSLGVESENIFLDDFGG